MRRRASRKATLQPRLAHQLAGGVFPCSLFIVMVTLSPSASANAGGRAAGMDLVWTPGNLLDVPATQRRDAERQRPASQSLGAPAAGRLSGEACVALHPPQVAFLPGVAARATCFGTDGLVGLLDEVADTLVRVTGGDLRLRYGNLSARGGGPFRWSRSHQSGRDADVAFFLRDAQGRPVAALAMTPWPGADHRGPRGETWDVATTWSWLMLLLEHGRDNVQMVFVSEPLRAALLAHGASTEAGSERLAHAAWALRQPSDARPHDDHLHVRVACRRWERREGCAHAGPLPPDRSPKELWWLPRLLATASAAAEGTALDLADTEATVDNAPSALLQWLYAHHARCPQLSWPEAWSAPRQVHDTDVVCRAVAETRLAAEERVAAGDLAGIAAWLPTLDEAALACAEAALEDASLGWRGMPGWTLERRLRFWERQLAARSSESEAGVPWSCALRGRCGTPHAPPPSLLFPCAASP